MFYKKSIECQARSDEDRQKYFLLRFDIFMAGVADNFTLSIKILGRVGLLSLTGITVKHLCAWPVILI